MIRYGPRDRAPGPARPGVGGGSAGVGAVTGVLSGAHDADTLRGSGATRVPGAVADLPALLAERESVRV
ncbi:hypothetical protein [Nocardiopsis sp. NPDC006938]|uniref:hypothetical protein n=1 Tax=Nocardiopsis sp. NPDC006938 TaxID=3364337 RepID=UPI0036AB5C39